MNALKEIIKFDDLYECTVISRVNRFTVIVEVRGSEVAAYINNTGRLHEYVVKGKVGYCIETPRGGLKYRIIGVKDGNHEGYAALLDTAYQEKAFAVLQERGMIPWLLSCVLYRRNYRLDREIIDFAYSCHEDLVLVELKSAVMKLEEGVAGYPDAPTVRGRRQIQALAEYAKTGKRAFITFIAGIPGARKVKLHCYADRKICVAAEHAARSGVLFKAINLYVDPAIKGVVSAGVDIPVELGCDVTT
ncbi:MAG: DNA/RNA nuclease SfsA [Desulfurococcaceae archaeon]